MIVSLGCFRTVFSCSSDWVCCLYGRCERQSAGSMPPLMCLHDLCKHSEDRSWTLSRLPTKHHWRYTRVSSLKGTQTGIHSTDAAHLDLCTRCQRSELSSGDRHFKRWSRSHERQMRPSYHVPSWQVEATLTSPCCEDWVLVHRLST